MSSSDTSKGTIDSDIPRCKPCLGDRKRVRASIYCIDCEECQCSQCYKVHRRFSFMKGHDTIDIEHGFTMTHLSRLRSYYICEDHSKKIEYNCVDENRLCCRKCKRENHKNCENVYPICDIASENPEMFVDLKARAFELKNQIMTVSKFLKNSEQELESESQLDDLRKELRETQETFIRRFEQFSSDMLKSGQDVIRRKKEKNNKATANCEIIKSELDDFFEVFSSFEHTSVFQQFIFQHKLEDKFAQCQTNASRLYAQLQTPGKLVVSYDNKMGSVVRHKFSFGDVYLGDNPIKLSDIPDYRAVRIDLFRNRTIRKRSYEDEDIQPQITGIDFLDNGRLVINDQAKKTQIIYSEELEEVKRKRAYGQRDTKWLSEGQIVIIQSNYVHFYETKNEEINYIKQIPMHMDNENITIIDEHSLFVGVSRDTRPAVRICEYGTGGDLNFQLLKEEDTSTKSLFFKTNATEILALSFRDKNTVVIVDMKKKAAKCITNDKTICQPGYMCIGPSDTFFVSCRSDKIVQLSLEGSVLVVLRSADILEPKVIAMSNDHRTLAVVGNGQIQVYNIIQD